VDSETYFASNSGGLQTNGVVDAASSVHAIGSSSSSSPVVLPKVFPLIFHETFFPLDNKREMQSQHALLYALAFEYTEKNKLNTHTHTHARSIYTKRSISTRDRTESAEKRESIMGHIEGERCPFFKGIIRVGNPKQKMAKKNSWSKSRQAVLFLALVLFSIIRERELERRETRDSERDTRARTHTHTHRERVFKKS